MNIPVLLRVTSVIAVNFDNDVPTDTSKLADDLQTEFPNVCRQELLEIIVLASATIGGRTIQPKPAVLSCSDVRAEASEDSDID